MKFYCNCCSHPLEHEDQSCPFCGVKDATHDCPTCHSVLLKLPDVRPGTHQYFCQHCVVKQGVILNQKKI